ncbi:MAG: dTDP-4-dehydrorhamnose 3,5-epimerase [Bacteroidetes bacterium]|nr:dTDP-4-dehydrorhamnose 3,5-epimerase [Bacteroidota bacterium]
MPFIDTPIVGLKIFEPKLFEDERGYFYESYNEKLFKENGIDVHFTQDNESKSSKGVLRGLHYQLAPYSQSKLVRALQGEVQDVVVDMRKKSPTYGKSFSIILSSENHKQLFVPRGFAHGFYVLSETTTILYKIDNDYSRESESGVMYNDPTLNIEWAIKDDLLILSEKDKMLSSFAEAKNNFE